MTAEHHVRSLLHCVMGDMILHFRELIGSLHAPVERADHKGSSLLLHLINGRFHHFLRGRQVIIAAVDPDLVAIHVEQIRLVIAPVRHPGDIQRHICIHPSVIREVVPMIVGGGHEIDPAGGKDPRIVGGCLKGEGAVRDQTHPVGERAFQIRNGIVVGFQNIRDILKGIVVVAVYLVDEIVVILAGCQRTVSHEGDRPVKWLRLFRFLFLRCRIGGRRFLGLLHRHFKQSGGGVHSEQSNTHDVSQHDDAERQNDHGYHSQDGLHGEPPDLHNINLLYIM